MASKISTAEQEKLLRDLVEEMAGENTGRIVDILFNKKDVNEFNISTKMELTINQVRNILYKLSAEGLVSFIRKKDKRKGWYIYYWTLDSAKCLVKLEQALLSKIQNLNLLLNNRETGRYYVCKPCGIEVNEEKALENGFSCEECAEVYELVDNTPYMKEIKSKIAKTEKDLKLIQGELAVIREKEQKKKEKEERKIAKEAQAQKDIRKKARELARKKVAETKKAVKKVIKKPVKSVKKVAKKTSKKR